MTGGTGSAPRHRVVIRRLFIALSLAGVVVATVVVLTGNDRATDALFSLPLPNHGAALGTMLAEAMLRGIRFVVLAAVMGFAVPLATSTLAQLAGDGGGAVTPGRSGADPCKALILHRRGVRGGHIGALLLGEALAEAFLLPVCAAVMALTLDVPLAALSGPLAWSLVALTIVGFAVGLAPSREATAPRFLQRLGVGGARWERIVQVAADFREAAGTLRRIRILPLALLAFATVGHIAARLLVLPALAGPATVLANPEALVAWPFFLLYGGSLIPAPGGAGLIEAGFVTMVGGYLPAAQVGAFAFWWRFYTFHLPAVLGWIVMVVTRREVTDRSSR